MQKTAWLKNKQDSVNSSNERITKKSLVYFIDNAPEVVDFTIFKNKYSKVKFMSSF